MPSAPVALVGEVYQREPVVRGVPQLIDAAWERAARRRRESESERGDEERMVGEGWVIGVEE